MFRLSLQNFLRGEIKYNAQKWALIGISDLRTGGKGGQIVGNVICKGGEMVIMFADVKNGRHGKMMIITIYDESGVNEMNFEIKLEKEFDAEQDLNLFEISNVGKDAYYLIQNKKIILSGHVGTDENEGFGTTLILILDLDGKSAILKSQCVNIGRKWNITFHGDKYRTEYGELIIERFIRDDELNKLNVPFAVKQIINLYLVKNSILVECAF